MLTRTMGEGGPSVSAIGLGCMGMSALYGQPDEAEAIRTIHRAIELGVDLLDTSASYGNGHNERLVAKAIRGRRDRVFLCTKFGIRRDDGPMRIDSTAQWARRSCEQSLERLGVDHIDLLYLHRRNPEVPIEETIGAMAELVQEGKVRYLGLSEVNPQTLRQAHDVHPIAALQSEYSLFSRDVEGDVLPVCRELGIRFVAYSPLGRALLTGQITEQTEFSEGDLRASNPRFATDNRATNLALVGNLRSVASEIGATPAQVALAWLVARDVVPIPGTKRVSWLEENVAAAELKLTPAQLAAIDAAVPQQAVAGERLPAAAARWVGF